MTLENDVYDVLEDLKYMHLDAISDLNSLDLIAFSKIVAWLSSEIQPLMRFESVVSAMESDDDLTSFKIELNALMREMSSPFDANDITQENYSRLEIINYLACEVCSARMIYTNKKESLTKNSMKIEINESETAHDLKVILMALGLKRPPDTITSKQLFDKLVLTFQDKIKKLNLKIEDPLMLEKGFTLSDEQWNKLAKLQEQFLADYAIRRQTLFTRCTCTIGSFKWKSGKADLTEKIDNVLQFLSSKINVKSSVCLPDALAAKESDCDELLNTVVSSRHAACDIATPETKGMANKGAQQRYQLHKFLIGRVPDRGGRPNEQAAPNQENFADQQKQRETQQHRGGGRGRGGSDRGGYTGGRGASNSNYNENRVQGSGWNQNDRWNNDKSGGRVQNHQNYSNDQYSQYGGQTRQYGNYYQPQQINYQQPQYDNYQQQLGYGQQQYYSNNDRRYSDNRYHQNHYYQRGRGGRFQ